MKLGPLLAMVAVLALGAWLVLQPTLQGRGEGVARAKVQYQVRPDPTDPSRSQFRLESTGSDASAWLDAQAFATQAAAAARAEKRGVGSIVKGAFNISNWWNFAWVAVGLAGQACFFGRMLLQWVTSERERKSVIPPIFWWLSFAGGVMLFVYFVWRRDLVGVLGQSTGVVIYARNIRLISKQRRREARRSLEVGGVEASTQAVG